MSNLTKKEQDMRAMTLCTSAGFNANDYPELSKPERMADRVRLGHIIAEMFYPEWPCEDYEYRELFEKFGQNRALSVEERDQLGVAILKINPSLGMPAGASEYLALLKEFGDRAKPNRLPEETRAAIRARAMKICGFR